MASGRTGRSRQSQRAAHGTGGRPREQQAPVQGGQQQPYGGEPQQHPQSVMNGQQGQGGDQAVDEEDDDDDDDARTATTVRSARTTGHDTAPQIIPQHIADKQADSRRRERELKEHALNAAIQASLQDHDLEDYQEALSRSAPEAAEYEQRMLERVMQMSLEEAPGMAHLREQMEYVKARQLAADDEDDVLAEAQKASIFSRTAEQLREYERRHAALGSAKRRANAAQSVAGSSRPAYIPQRAADARSGHSHAGPSRTLYPAQDMMPNATVGGAASNVSAGTAARQHWSQSRPQNLRNGNGPSEDGQRYEAAGSIPIPMRSRTGDPRSPSPIATIRSTRHETEQDRIRQSLYERRYGRALDDTTVADSSVNDDGSDSEYEHGDGTTHDGTVRGAPQGPA